MAVDYEGKPVFAAPGVRIYDGLDYEGAFMRYAEHDFPTEGPRSEGPFVLLEDYQALMQLVEELKGCNANTGS